jgi:hypothetical protein
LADGERGKERGVGESEEREPPSLSSTLRPTLTMGEAAPAPAISAPGVREGETFTSEPPLTPAAATSPPAPARPQAASGEAEEGEKMGGVGSCFGVGVEGE